MEGVDQGPWFQQRVGGSGWLGLVPEGSTKRWGGRAKGFGCGEATGAGLVDGG